LSLNLEPIRLKLRGVLVKRPGVAIAIQGVAGIGKTHAVQRLLRETPCASCSLHATRPLAQILHAVMRSMPRSAVVPTWTKRILERFEGDEDIEPEWGLQAFSALLSKLAPFVLHLEDMHEVSSDRLALIRLLAGMVKRAKGVALLVTSRQAPPDEFEALRLEPLAVDEMRDMLAFELQSALPPEAVDWLFERTAGHPLFALEFLRYLVSQGHLWNNGQRWAWRAPTQPGLPITVEALIEDALGLAMTHAFVPQVLRTKAMIPRDSSLDTWREVSGLTETQLREGRLALIRAGILKNDQLSHPLFREVTLQTMPPTERREVARRTMLALKDHPVLAVEYLARAELSVDQQKAWLEAAVQSATQQQDWSLAADLTVQALELYGPLERTVRARAMAYSVSATNLPKASSLFAHMESLETEDTYAWAAILAQIGQLPQALALLEGLPSAEQSRLEWRVQSVRVLSLGEDAARAIQCWDAHPALQGHQDAAFLMIVAKSLMTLSRFPEAGALLERAVVTAPSNEVKAQVLLTRGRLKAYLDDCSPMEDLQQALELFEQSGDSNGRAMTHYRLGIEWYYQGRTRLALQHGETAKALFEKLGSQQYWTCAVMVYSIYTELAMYAEAERGLLEADAHLAQTSFQALRVDVNTHLSYLYRYWQIPYGAMLAVKFARQALQIARAIQNPRVECNALYHLSKSETLLGHAKEGFALANRALDLARELRFPAMQKYPLHARYQALKALGRLEEALQDLAHVQALMRQEGYLQDADFFRLELEVQRGNLVEARQCLERLRHNDNHAWVETALRLYPELATHAVAPTPAPRRVLQVLGEVQIDGQGVQGRRRQELLAWLLEARVSGRSGMARLELLEALYPGENEIRAGSRLKELIRGTRASWGADLVRTTANGYALGNVTSDLERFLATGDSSLWRGVYLRHLELGQASTVLETLSLALRTRAEEALIEHPREAARLAKLLLEMNPYDLECLRLQIRALQACENYKTLGRAYSEARGSLLDVGVKLPEHWSEFLTDAVPA
jgi:tetratricopeptide (TPR) repeat protein